MPIEIIVPRLGWSMEEGAFVAWLKNEGEFVNAGDPLFSIEGDKAIQEVESIDSGYLKIAPNSPSSGATIRVGDLLGYLLAAGETWTSPKSSTNPPDIRFAVKEPASASPSPLDPPPPATGSVSERRPDPLISPRALRLANELGVDWRELRGGGRSGRIRERDVRMAASVSVGTGRDAQLASSVQSRSESIGTGHSVVCFGELLMRLSTANHERFAQSRRMEVCYTGAEANAAVSLACLGVNAAVVSAVPENDLGQSCVNFIRQHGVDTRFVVRGGPRLGTFFLETGAFPRASQVIYDRAGSSFSMLQPGAFDWDQIFAGRSWFHWSGTAPAVGSGLPSVIREACAAARGKGVRISCDVNYRSKLWRPEEARKVLTGLLEVVDVVIGSEDHLILLLADKVEELKVVPSNERPGWVAREIRSRFGCSEVAVTTRESDDFEGHWFGATVLHRSGESVARKLPVSMVDRIGAGDAFSAGLIYSMLHGSSAQEAVDFAVAAGALKHSIPGDFNLASLEEILQVAKGDMGHRVLR